MANPYWKRLMSAGQEFHIWEGVYDKWSDAPEIDGAFNSEKWLNDQAASVMKEIAGLGKDRESISSCAISHDYILPTVAAMARKNGQKLRIMDFGGGLASSLPLVKASLPPGDDIEFHVVESEGICRKGREVFPEGLNLFFHAKLPTDLGKYDVIHAGRSFQYIDDWRGLLCSFSRLEPRYLILAGALAGDMESFVSVQNYYGYKIRVRFLNRKELISEVEHLGYRLILKSLHMSKRLGKEGPLPMDNFPVERRLEHPCQLLFERACS